MKVAKVLAPGLERFGQARGWRPLNRRTSLDTAGFLVKNTPVVWRSVVEPMQSEECRERASHCFHLADSARSDQSRSTFNSLAKHWLRLAEELEHDRRPDDRRPATSRPRSPMHR